jgi:hypothetical protein
MIRYIVGKHSSLLSGLFCLFLLSLSACTKKHETRTSFYYWKTSFQLNTHQKSLLKNTAGNRLYLRFFDVVWDEQQKQVLPHAILKMNQSGQGLQICPVVYITNKALEHTTAAQTDSLAIKIAQLLKKLAEKNNISYQAVQIDCDWTVSTKDSYFSFLKSFKKYSKKPLEATIRLHQVKYFDLTGVPPVDKGLLMFYNMGKVSADLNSRNSIYNAPDAEKYVVYLQHYPLPLAIALPLFSWSVHIRDGKVIQIYSKLRKKELGDTTNFRPAQQQNIYRAVKSFYLQGIYIKTNDLFKLEDINSDQLQDAAKQAAKYLPVLKNRNIIYYELSTIDSTSFQEKDFQEISAYF